MENTTAKLLLDRIEILEAELQVLKTEVKEIGDWRSQHYQWDCNRYENLDRDIRERATVGHVDYEILKLKDTFFKTFKEIFSIHKT